MSERPPERAHPTRTSAGSPAPADPEGWDAALRSSLMGGYFRDAAAVGAPRPRARGFDAATAWWLLDLCRLCDLALCVSCEHREDHGLEPPERILARAGLDLVREIRRRRTGCLVVRGEARGEPWHAVVFRGVCGPAGWLGGLRFWAAPGPRGGRVHAGFLSAFRDVEEELAGLWPTLEGPVVLTGHSAGGALALLVATSFPAAAVYTFGAPRLGDAAFARSLRGVPVHRVTNSWDLVSHLPPAWIAPYGHVGASNRLETGARRVVRRDRVRPPDASLLTKTAIRLINPVTWRHPPPPAVDHALINYLARLQALALGVAGASADGDPERDRPGGPAPGAG